MIKCQKCGIEIRTYSKMRKWCTDCRKNLANERLRDRFRKNSSYVKD
ncbi:hypothetical protein J4468_03570 [Candidatus Woesearchaeota archaeon]|nr:hypothetical protein [Candidatus Woesearchaeota archaeon]